MVLQEYLTLNTIQGSTLAEEEAETDLLFIKCKLINFIMCISSLELGKIDSKFSEFIELLIISTISFPFFHFSLIDRLHQEL